MISMLVWEYNLPSWRMRNNGEVYWSGQQIFQLKWTSSKTGLLSKILPSLNEDLEKFDQVYDEQGAEAVMAIQENGNFAHMGQVSSFWLVFC